MSSIKRGVRKVFRGAKRVVRKIAKPALVVGAIYLTAGLATGFAPMAAGSGLPGFLSSVGTTIGNGAKALGGALGFGGATAPAVGAGNLPASLQAATYASAATPAATAAAQSSGILSGVGGFLSKAGKAFTSLSDPVQTAILTGASNALQGAAARKEARRLERREDETGLFGARRRGGGGLIEGDFGAAVRAGFGLDAAPTTASAGLLEAAPMPEFRDFDPRQQEEEEIGTLAGGFGLERGLLAQSQANMPQFV